MLKEEPYTQKEADAAAGIGQSDFYTKWKKAQAEKEGEMEIEA